MIPRTDAKRIASSQVADDCCLLVLSSKAIGRVDGLVISDEEVRKLMFDSREAWRSRIKMIVAANKEAP
jgi:hypothetical protein